MHQNWVQTTQITAMRREGWLTCDNALSQRELLLTASEDGMLYIRNLMKPQPLLVAEPSAKGLHAVQWSPCRPLVFAAAAGQSPCPEGSLPPQLAVAGCHKARVTGRVICSMLELGACL